MIYFIQCGTNGPIKIGYTDNGAEERMAQLQTGCPYELSLLWVYNGDEWSEGRIHSQLAAERVRGEWFHPSNNLFSFIEEELCNFYEILTSNGRHIDLYEYFNRRDFISIKTGIEPGEEYHNIYHDFKTGSVTISTAKNNGVYTELYRVR